MDGFMLKHRLIQDSKLHGFTHNANLQKRVSKKFGWSKSLTNVVLDAYNEFLELKIVFRDWNDMQLVPSWCIQQVWKVHVLDTKVYSDVCVSLCGHLIQYDIDSGIDKEFKNQRIELTRAVYKERFNRTLCGSVWSFEHVSTWWMEYTDLKQDANLESDCTKSTEKTISKCLSNASKMNNKRCYGTDLSSNNVAKNCPKVSSVKEDYKVERKNVKSRIKSKSKRINLCKISAIITRSAAKKQKLTN
ncbi:uncharacterized protein LOC130621110 [Hydractinia symbiolongicarpus]|uniref:uncharacterized protein LOC130621110 n=1 Tax=Hydractinia symbiolongicarpus TaxID=13093 RepID=UPI00254B6DDE|nr:uncharacterized protein LOC130621110 [Hydractinia symbiolongicarpus]